MAGSLIYFLDGDVVAESGQVKVYKFNDQLFLEKGPGHNLWALESELEDYIFQLGSSPMGDCLEIGLGLGVASKYMLTFPRIKTLTTVELDEDVIEVQKKANPIDDQRHIVLNAHGLYYAYETSRLYDFIFLDFYSHIDEDTLPEIADMVEACRRLLKRKGRMIGWLDKYTPGKYAQIFMEMFD